VAANVFDLWSGETHWLSPLGLELLHLLADQAQTSPALASALVEVFGDLAAARKAIDDELPRLRRIGLVAGSA
jgi:PqqD family protein of HPr-rel-A system